MRKIHCIMRLGLVRQGSLMAVNSYQFSDRLKLTGVNGPAWIIRYIYYAFIFSVPFEAMDIGIGRGYFTLSKMVGYLFLAVTPIQPRLCFKFPPKAFWWFTIYVYVVYVLGGILQRPEFINSMIIQLFSLFQMLILFWISYNLMQYEQVLKGTLLTLAASCIVLAALLDLGVMGEAIAYGTRISAPGDNPNTVANVLTLGLLALLGLAYGRERIDFKVRLLFWSCSGILALAIVHTGSRGAVVAFGAGLLTFLLKNKSLGSKLKIGLIIILTIGLLGLVSYQVGAIRERWERTIREGDTAGRDKIFQMAWSMFWEKPLTGWGPVQNIFELGSRLGFDTKDPHNLYLWVLTEGGLVGAFPFFIGMWLCWHAAWKARNGIQGVLPLAMIICLFVGNMKGTDFLRKLFWVVQAYALASGSYIVPPRQQRKRIRFIDADLCTSRSKLVSPLPDYVIPLQDHLDS